MERQKNMVKPDEHANPFEIEFGKFIFQLKSKSGGGGRFQRLKTAASK